MRLLFRISLTATAAVGCGSWSTELGRDECVVLLGAGATGCAAAEGIVRDSTGRPMPAVYMYFGGSLTLGRVTSGFGENRGDNNITDQAGHYLMRTVLQGDHGVVVTDTATVWIIAARIDTLPSGVTVHGPRDSVAALLRFGPAGPTTPITEVRTITLPRR